MAEEVKGKTENKVVGKSEVNKSQSNDSSNTKQKIRVRRSPRNNRKRKKGKRGEEREFERKIVSVRRVARVYEGGKRMRLSVCLVIGDKKGRVGIGLAKGSDVRAAEEKAYNYAKKHLVKVPLDGNTIPHEVYYKKGAAKVFMKPAVPGTGVVAGSSLRAVLEVAGVKDILTKILGTNNHINNAYAAVEALSQMKPRKTVITEDKVKSDK